MSSCEDGAIITVPIERAHMEEDAGKLTHVGGSTGRIQGAEYSLVDYNRAGVPLVEIVTKPIYGTEHRAPEVAKAYVSTIRDIVRSLGISEATHGARQPPLRRQHLPPPPRRPRPAVAGCRIRRTSTAPSTRTRR